MPLERLQKIIAKAGVASRREAEEMIRDGRVTVNGKVVTELGTRADNKKDHVKVDGKLLHSAEEPRYILLNKPREVMTTTADPEGRTTVIDLLRGVRERVFPVGRLDYHSEGLLLLTNDGDLAFKVSHPSNGSVKTYHVKVRGVPSPAVIEKLERGIVLDNRRTQPCEIRQLRTTGKGEEEGNSWWEVKLREGRTNQIRRMFQIKGHPVSKLRRIAIGALTDARLAPGEWRELDTRELSALFGDEKRRTQKRSGRASSERKPTAAKAGAAPSRKAAAKKPGAAAAKKGGTETKRAARDRASAGTSRTAAPAKKRTAAPAKKRAVTRTAASKRSSSITRSPRSSGRGDKSGR